MNRYLGTKTKILPSIAAALAGLGDVRSVCDIFAGSLAVSLFLKRRGHRVIANDVNRLSYAYARAYLTPSRIPQFDVDGLFPRLRKQQLRRLQETGVALLAT